MVRLVAVWCPSLTREGPDGDEPRRFAAVELAPFARPVRLGVLTIPSKGPSRFFGGEAAFCELLGRALTPHVGDGQVGVGVAEGLFAAVLAARSSVIVPTGATPEFLAPWSVATLRDPDLAATCQRLGLHTLGRFARLDEARVLERFGLEAVRRHRVARGIDGELPGLRDPAALRRLDAVRRRDDPRDVQRGVLRRARRRRRARGRGGAAARAAPRGRRGQRGAARRRPSP